MFKVVICLEQSVLNKLSVLNNFQQRSSSPMKWKLAFLDILLHRGGHNIITIVYRIVTNNDVYLNWYSFCPREWKRGTFRSLIQRVYIICSSSHILKVELKYLEDIFAMKNNFPIWVVKKILNEEKEKIDNRNNVDKINILFKQMQNLKVKIRVIWFCYLPYQTKKGLHLIKSLKRNLKSLSHITVKANIGFTGKNLSGHQISERIIDYNRRDQKSHIFKHSSEKCH